MDKSPDAFRTISEVADWLDTPTHVLRFWESRFTQVKPVKRAGGRRYYRPSDMELLGGIKQLLHNDGMTIRGVQKLLREEGVKHVAAMSPPLDSDMVAEDRDDTLDGAALPDTAATAPAPMVTDAPQETDDNVVPLSRTLAETEDHDRESLPSAANAASERQGEPEEQQSEPAAESDDARPDLPSRTEPEPEVAAKPEPEAEPEIEEADEPEAEIEPAEARAKPDPEPEPAVASAEPDPEAAAPRPAIVDVPPDPEDDDTSLPVITDVAAQLRRTASGLGRLSPAPADLQRVYDRLVMLRDKMAADKRH